MNNLENEIFEFGNENDKNLEQTPNNFNYDSISGLGESDYENDDLFTDEVEEENGSIEVNSNDELENYSDNGDLFNVSMDNDVQNVNDKYGDNKVELENDQNDDLSSDIVSSDEQTNDELDDIPAQDIELKDTKNYDENINDNQFGSEEDDEDVSIPSIKISDTDIEEIKSLTNYKTEEIDKTDINALFDRVSVNVKDASEIFKKNSEMKEKLDSRFEEIKQLQAELEKNKTEQMEEINSYKKEVFNKLNSKKIEIEKRLNTLKDLQASLEKEKGEFEQYKKSEQDKIEKVQKDIQIAYDDRREELSKVEDNLRKQKDELDEERNQLSLDRIQYEADKNDLANNILKFNELVDSFTSSVNEVNE